MDFKAIIKKAGPFLAAAILFITAAIIWGYPETKGKVIGAPDSSNARAAVQEEIEYTSQTGHYSWWNGSMFSGMPDYQIGGGRYKSDVLLDPLKSILHKGHSSTIWIFIIYFFCFFILMTAFDIDRWLAIAGSFAITLSSYFVVIIAAGHNGKTSTIALMSVVLAAFYLIFRKKYGIGVVLAMLFTACGFSTHPQMAYYIFMMIGLLWFAELWLHLKEKRMKDFLVATLLFALAVGIGLGANSANVFANAEYAAETMRGGHSDLAEESTQASGNGLDIEYATQWSYGAGESFSFLIPGIRGGSSNFPVGSDSDIFKTIVAHGFDRREAAAFCTNVPVYWGDQPFTAGNVYMGAIVCFLFLLGLLTVEGPYKWGLLAATVFSVLLALGSNFMPLTELFFKYFPLYNKFRAVSSILIVAEIAMPLLGFLAVKALMDGSVPREQASKKILVAGGITAGICLLFFLLGGAIFTFTGASDAQFASHIPEWLYDAIIDERRRMLRSDSLRSALFILAACALLWLYSKGKLKKGWMIASLGILIALDMWPVDRRYLNDNVFVPKKSDDSFFAIQPYEETLLQDSTYFRVYNMAANTFSDARTSYRLKSIGGYSAAKLRRYQDLIDEHLANPTIGVMDMLNVKYFIFNDDKGKVSIMQNPGALGNAWFVSDLVEAGSARAESDSLKTLDLHQFAVIDSGFVPMVKDMHPGTDPDSYIELVAHTPDSRDYVSSSAKDAVAVFSEIYYPHGWKASIDGREAEHFRVNYILRAMNIPAGVHQIHFVFDPDSVRKGDTIAVIMCVLMYLICLGVLGAALLKCFRKA